MASSVINPERIIRFVTGLLAPVMHLKRARSIAFAVLGAMHADRWSICAIGRAMACVRGMSPKHGIKQVDRLLGNRRFEVEAAFAATAPWLVANRRHIVASLDWTEYGADGHSRIAVNLITGHGRATPLVWKTVETKRLKRRRNRYEDEVLYLLADVLPPGVHVTLLADRGFGDTKLYALLRDELKWDFVIRFRAGIGVENAEGEYGRAGEWVPANGRIREIADARVTSSCFPVVVVCAKKRGMKDAWCLATTLKGQKERVVALYGRRFTCEENFRDEKDRRYGFGVLETTFSTPERRDRFLVIAMLATILLTLVGAAGESVGGDQQLKPNTTSRRTHSFLRQGREYLSGAVYYLRHAIRDVFDQLLRGHRNEAATFAVI